MRCTSPSNEPPERERGSAPLEFIGVGLILLVPLVYLVLALGTVQEHTLGAEAAARHAARAMALAPDEDTARTRAEAIVRAMALEYRMPDDAVSISLECIPASAPCPQAGATVRVVVRSEAVLPFVPPALGVDRLATIPITAEALQKVSRQWGER